MIKNSFPAISVIVPIYNAQLYLRDCVNSIITQDFKDLEIILIDDGSTDGSLQICEKYAKADHRITIINKSNGGVASARNAGLQIANGEYIIHADADDIVLPNAYSNLYQIAKEKEADIVIGNYLKGSLDNYSTILHNFQTITSQIFIQEMLLGKVHGSLCNKLIKRNLYSGLCFEPNIDFMEDLLILIKILNNNLSAKIIAINKSVYHYVLQPTSYTNQMSLQYLRLGDRVIETAEHLIGDDKIYLSALTHFKIFHILLYILNVDTTTLDVKKIFPEVHLKVWQTSLSVKYKILLTFEFLNIHFISKAYKYLKRN